MSGTYAQAQDDIFLLFNSYWQANTSALVGYVPEIRWQGKEIKDKPDSTRFWCKASTQVVTEGQRSLSNCVLAQGQKGFEVEGFVTIQLFCPKHIDNSQRLGTLLAQVAKAAFRGRQTPIVRVWFRNTVANEIKPEEMYNRFNVMSEFIYDEIG